MVGREVCGMEREVYVAGREVCGGGKGSVWWGERRSCMKLSSISHQTMEALAITPIR